MRFCPFCAHENADEVAQCARCGKRLPPPRRQAGGTDGKDGHSVSPAPPSAKPNLPSRPGGLAPKSPLRSRAESILAQKPGQTGSQAAIKAPTGSQPAIKSPTGAQPAIKSPTGSQPAMKSMGTAPTMAATPVAPPNRPGSRPPPPPPAVSAPPVTNPQGFRHSALPLPPPPSDYKVPMHTPTVLRDATSSPHMVSTNDEEGNTVDERRPVVPPPPVPVPQRSLPEDVIDTAPQQTLSSIDRARMAGERAWKATRKAVDFGAVQYVITHTRETMRRRREISRLQKEIVTEQQRMDAILAQLGRQARQADLGLPALADEMRATKALETDANAARDRIADYERRRADQEAKFQAAERELQAAVANADQIALKLTEELAAKSSERAGHRAGMNRLDAQLKSLQRHAETKQAELGAVQDPTQAATLRGDIDATRAQIGALEPEQKRFAQKAAELDAPIADLETRTQTAKEDASRRRREMGDATRVHTEAVGQINAQIEAEKQKITQSDRELSLKFVTLGTILNLNRVPGSAFDQLYQEFDGIKGAITEREQQIGLLEAEIKGVDRGRFNKGLIVMVSGAVLIALVIAIIVH